MVNIKTLLDKATNPDLSEPDWETILDIVEEIKQNNVSVKNAVKELRKKLLDSNSTVVYYTLQVLDSIMKNCASDVHKEILSPEFMGVVKTVITSSRDGRSDRAIDKAIELIGEWKAAFGSQSSYKAVQDMFGELEREGFFIPEPQVASAAFVKQPPEWIMGERCHMCRQEFSRLRGYFRHHCRNCGKSICTSCSSKRAPLPDYGINEPTRVCDICYKKVAPLGSAESGSSGAKGAGSSAGGTDLPEEYLRSSLAKESQVPSTGSTEETKMQEDDDLQLAIAMSLNEQENKKKTSSASPAPPPSSTAPSAPPPSTTPSLYSSIAQEAANTAAASPSLYSLPPAPPPEQQPLQPPQGSSAADPNLARYLDRSYWEQRKEQQASGGVAPVGGAPPAESVPTSTGPVPSSSGSPLADTVQSTVEQFVQRLQQVSAAGGSVAADPVILSLYQNLNALHPQLLKQIDDVQQHKVRQEQLLHKINEAKTARAALNTMRREHQDKVRQQEQEQTLLARMQMEQKLALLRQQKQEQLVYEQSLQQKRLEDMHAKRQEYEKQLASQRELERQQLIAQEQQVLQSQLRGGSPIHMQQQQQQQQQQQVLQSQLRGGSPIHMQQQQQQMQQQVPVQPQYQPQAMAQVPMLDPTSHMHTLSLHDPTTVHQAPPLPTKLDHNVAVNHGPASLPPPYQPASLQPVETAFQTMPPTAVYQDAAAAPPPLSSYADTASLWVSNTLSPSQPHTLTSTLHQLHSSPTSTPPQQPSPMNIVQPLGGGAGQMPVGGRIAPYNAHLQYQPQSMVSVSAPQQMTMQPPQQVYQPTANFTAPPTMTEHVPLPQTVGQLPEQQLMSMQPMSMQPMSMQPLSMPATAPPPGLQRPESGPPLIMFD